MSAHGAKIYSKGDLVKENLSTDENGACVLKNLHLGTYVVKEVQAPENFYNAGEEKEVTLSYAGQNVEVVFSDVTFTNDRQKADVNVCEKRITIQKIRYPEVSLLCMLAVALQMQMEQWL